MRIDSGTIGMESARSYNSIKCSRKQFNVIITRPEDTQSNLPDTMNFGVRGASKTDEIMTIQDKLQKLREECINLLMRLLFPERKLELTREDAPTQTSSSSVQFNQGALNLSYCNEYLYQEEEYVSFEAKGLVKCADGRELDFNLNLEMSRSFCEYYSEEVNFLEQALCDPLVINFDESVTSLGSQTFRFDIDSDGVEDEISNLVAGCGFLALDENEDGVINDGRELFGTSSGNGFKDLAKFDTDGDGFIDEDDKIFHKLRIMTIDEEGNQHLYSLKDKDIGAICLKSQVTDFNLNALEDNSQRGVIRSTGIFLRESGGVGTVQQIDMVKHQKAIAAYA